MTALLVLLTIVGVWSWALRSPRPAPHPIHEPAVAGLTQGASMRLRHPRSHP